MDFDANIIAFQRGATIFKAGDPARQIYVLKSGLVTLCIIRGDKLVELAKISPNQLIGAEALQSGATAWTYGAIAANDVEIVPIALESARSWIDCCPPLLKLFATSLLAKTASVEAASLASLIKQKDPLPCSAERVTRLFAILYHAAAYTSTVKKDANVVVWSAFRKYCQRGFLESPVRLEQAIYILVRVGLAKLEMIPCETDPDGPEEIGFVHFTDLPKIRFFYETFHRLKKAAVKDMIAEANDPLYTAMMQEIEHWNTNGKVQSPLSDLRRESEDRKRAG
jgi:CRP-like cAMP-binding protein